MKKIVSFSDRRRGAYTVNKAAIIEVLDKNYPLYAAKYISLFSPNELTTFGLLEERVKYILSVAKIFPEKIKYSTVLSIHSYLKTGAS